MATIHRRNLLMLFGFSAALWLPTCGLWDLWGPDEGRYAQVAKELLGRGDWLLLTLNGEPYDQKPPLPFWIYAGMTWLNGGAVSPWALRVPPVLFAIATVLMTYGIGAKRCGARCGLIAALVLMTSMEFLEAAPAVELNTMYAGWITLALFAWLTRPVPDSMSLRRAALFWFALAGAFFTKGPLAFFVVASAVLTEAVAARSWSRIRMLRPAAGGVLLAAAIGGWFWGQSAQAGAGFVAEQIREQTLERFFEGTHEEPFWYYFPRLFTSVFAPWGVLLVPAGVVIWRHRSRALTALRPIVGWTLWPFLFLCLASGKRQSYLLPLLPGLALIVGWYLSRARIGAQWHARVKQVATVSFFALVAAAFVAAVLAAAAWPWLWNRGVYLRASHAPWLGVASAALACAGLWTGRLKPTPRSSLASAIILILFSAAANYAFLRPTLNPRKSSRGFAQDLTSYLKSRDLDPAVAAIGKGSKPEYHAHGGYRIESLDWDEAESAATEPEVVVVRAKDWNEWKRLPMATRYEVARRDVASGDELIVFGRRSTKAAPSFAQESIALAFAGDTGTGKPRVRKIAERIAAVHDEHRLAGVFLAGDNFYGEKTFEESVDYRFMKPFAPVITRNIPFFAALGNHDHRDGMLEEEVQFPLFNMQGRRYYSKSFGKGAVTVFVLDSVLLSNDPEQFIWFRNELAATNSAWKILVLHYPLEASEFAHGPDRELNRLLTPVITAEHDVDIVISGHNHVYERRAIKHGIKHITVGGSGRLDDDEPFPEDSQRLAGYNEKLSFLWMKIEGDKIRAQALNEDGEVVDEVRLQDMKNLERLRLIDS